MHVEHRRERENIECVMIIEHSQSQLLQIVFALRASCRFAGLLDRWQQQCNENCDDRDDHKQFN